MRYFCRQTRRVADLLQRIERARVLIDELPTPTTHIESIQRRALLKSAVFSARIEGNPLAPSDISLSEAERPSRTIKKREIGNLVRAIRFIGSPRAPRRLSLSLIKRLHAFVMNGIDSDAGHFRTDPSAIFTESGVALYVAPSPNDIKNLLLELIDYVSVKAKASPQLQSMGGVSRGAPRSGSPPPARQSLVLQAPASGWVAVGLTNDRTPGEPSLIAAAITHVWFEKIHPFLDGNGRVGRLLFSYLFQRGGYGMRGAVPFEEFIDRHRQDYYDVLRPNRRDVTPAVEFLLEALSITAEQTIDQLKGPLREGPETLLFPRRQEILDIIRDHHIVSFDFLHRRFMNIPDSTLHFDLKQLLKDRLIKKIGKTRGARYASVI